MPKYYKPSGKFSPLSFIFLVLMCLTAIPVLSLVYSYAIWYIPFIYLNFLIAAGFGFGIAMGVNRLVIGAGKVRNGALAALLALFCAAFALYVHWAIWLDLVINSGESYGSSSIGITVSNISFLEALGLALQPQAIIELIGLVNESGTWGFKGTAVSGLFLSLIWAVEALIITAIPVFLVYGRAKKPFCETSGNWAKEKVLPPLEFISNEAALKSALEQGDFSFLTIIKRAQDPAKEKHSLFTLYYSDAKAFYLSVENKSPEVNDKGEVSFNSSEFVEYLIIDARTGEMLMQLDKIPMIAAAV